MMWVAIIHVLKVLACAAILVLVSYVIETLTYRGLKYLERHGVIERLAPQIDTTIVSYQPQAAYAFFGSSAVVLLIAFHPSIYGPLIQLAQPNWSLMEIALTCWVGVALHDFWFWAIHSILHKVKWLYRRVHIIHHRLGGDLTVFGTADMDVFEALVMVFGFYAATLVYYVHVGHWNPVAYTALVLLEANMNMMGHCAYRQPLWLALLQTGGVCLTPGVAHAKTHYIHHLDPRFNRALYFSWWDRLGGTFKDKHPYIREFTAAEQWEYELRAFRMLGGKLSRLVTSLAKRVAV